MTIIATPVAASVASTSTPATAPARMASRGVDYLLSLIGNEKTLELHASALVAWWLMLPVEIVDFCMVHAMPRKSNPDQYLVVFQVTTKDHYYYGVHMVVVSGSSIENVNVSIGSPYVFADVQRSEKYVSRMCKFALSMLSGIHLSAKGDLAWLPIRRERVEIPIVDAMSDSKYYDSQRQVFYSRGKCSYTEHVQLLVGSKDDYSVSMVVRTYPNKKIALRTLSGELIFAVNCKGEMMC